MAGSKSRGRKSWPPFKAKFLETHREGWEEAKRTKKAALFYDRLTAAFIARFGYDLGYYVDPIEEPNSDVIPLVDGEKIPGQAGLSAGEKDQRKAYFTDLRTKLTMWCNHHYRKNYDNAYKDETNALFRQIANTECDNLRRKPDYQVYQKLYYKERVLETFNERWAAALAEAEAGNLPKPTILSVRQKVVQECWEQETQEIKENVREAAEADQQRRKAELQDGMSPPTTPEDYQNRLDHCAPFVKAIADALYERTGLVVSILLAGPIPCNEGDIGLRSYHAGATSDVMPRPWPQFDREGFAKVESSMVSFASRVFPLSERQKRALPASSSRSNTPIDDDELEKSTTPDPTSDGSQDGDQIDPKRQATQQPLSSASLLPRPSSSPPAPDPTPSPLPLLPPSPSQLPPPSIASGHGADAGSLSATPSQPLATSHRSTDSSEDTSAPHAQTEQVTLPLRILIDGGCPDRLLDTYRQLATAEFDLAWTECVTAFARLQVKSGFSDPKGTHLPLTSRPVEYAVWFKYHRPSAGPQIDSHEDFLNRLDAWWRSMQPSIRGSDGRERLSAQADWSSILTPGQNGIFLVLCGLLWAGIAIFEGAEDSLLADWSTLVNDVAWVLQHDAGPLSKVVESSPKKRTASKSSSRPSKRPRA